MKVSPTVIFLFLTAAMLMAQPPSGAASRSQSSNLAMGQWRFISIGEAHLAAVGRQQAYLKFEARNHSVTGFTGCNRLSGSYRADESSLAFTQIVTTRMACAGDNHEPQVLEALNATTGYKIVDHQLRLTGVKGTLAILLRPHEEQTTQQRPPDK